MKTLRILNLGFAVLGLFLAATILAFLARTSQAQGAIEMGLDMETTGNAGDALGPIERCYELAWSGTPFDGVVDWTIDVYVAGDTLSPLAYDAWVTYDNNKVHVLQGAPTDPLIKMPGAGDLSGYQVGQASFGAIYLDLPYNGIPGDGTLVRVGLDIGASGLVALGFAKGAYISAPGSLQHSVTTVGGQLAINEVCPAAPTPTPPPSVGGTIDISVGGPDASAGSAAADSSADSSAWYFAALAGGAAMVILAVASGAWFARRRWGR